MRKSGSKIKLGLLYLAILLW